MLTFKPEIDLSDLLILVTLLGATYKIVSHLNWVEFRVGLMWKVFVNRWLSREEKAELEKTLSRSKRFLG